MRRFLLILAGVQMFMWSCTTNPSTNPIVYEQTDSAVVEPKSALPKAEPSRKISLDEKIGQMVMIGIMNKKIISENDSLLSEIRNKRVGGILIYEKNIAKSNAPDSLKRLIAALQKAADTELFISIDEEGGKVHRLREKYGFVAMPSQGWRGKVDNTDSTYFYNKRLADVLYDMGFTINYAPDVDLALNAKNPIIAKVERSYSADPAKVTRHAQAAIRAHHDAKIKTIIKHFPGHGSSAEDTHLGIADVTRRWQMIELMPFSDLIKSGECDAIMTAHIVNCTLDSSCLPATLSKTIITGLLRGMMGYKGVVFSDDMQMHAISKHYGTEEAVRLSILAGVDVMMFGNNVPGTEAISATRVHAIIKHLVTTGQISEARIEESYNRIMELKKKN